MAEHFLVVHPNTTINNHNWWSLGVSNEPVEPAGSLPIHDALNWSPGNAAYSATDDSPLET